jgi:4-diphosphocytidyl-2-C-methyl-D-erythritol kinase
LIFQAALLLKEKFGIEKGARIHLEKNIPSPGGLGGGSSDAAVALLGLVRLWNLPVDTGMLSQIGAALGSDVPFFFYGGTALGAGRGTEIVPLADIEEKFLLIITPNVKISTPAAFARLNKPRLTNLPAKSILQLCRDEAEKQHFRQSNPQNDFESVIFEIEPEIERVKKMLLETGAKSALMSGSGASVFGIFDTEETRQATIKATDHEKDWRRFAVATVSREVYSEALKVVSD